MDPKLTALVLFTLVAGFCIVPAVGQHPMLKYNVFLDFTSYCSVDSVTVLLHDQSGHVVATATSPFGGEIEISFMTPTPISALTASATGRVSIGTSWDQYARAVSGTATIVVGTDELYYWITVLMH